MLLIENEPTLNPQNSVTSPKPDPLGLTPLPVDNRQRFLRFMLFQRKDALLSLEKIVEVLQLSLEDIFPVPDMSSCILGVCNWRGETLWLIDLNHLVGYPPLCQQSQFLTTPIVIVVQCDGRSLGLVVEQVSDVDLIDTEKIHIESGLCPPKLEPFISGYCPQQTGTLLNISAIVNAPILQSHY
jgi:positive phototaxis protein PixI